MNHRDKEYFLVMIILLIIILLAGYIAYIFNRLVTQKNLLKEAWSGIDVQLKRRHDLIPNLVETVKGYSSHEQTTLEEVVKLRTQSEQTSEPAEKAEIEKTITDGMQKLFALAEDYPDLKAQRSFSELQQALVDIEDDLQSARRYYNGTVRDLNILVESFPSNIIANLLGFETTEFFEINYVTERKVPDVSF